MSLTNGVTFIEMLSSPLMARRYEQAGKPQVPE